MKLTYLLPTIILGIFLPFNTSLAMSDEQCIETYGYGNPTQKAPSIRNPNVEAECIERYRKQENDFRLAQESDWSFTFKIKNNSDSEIQVSQGYDLCFEPFETFTLKAGENRDLTLQADITNKSWFTKLKESAASVAFSTYLGMVTGPAITPGIGFTMSIFTSYTGINVFPSLEFRNENCATAHQAISAIRISNQFEGDWKINEFYIASLSAIDASEDGVRNLGTTFGNKGRVWKKRAIYHTDSDMVDCTKQDSTTCNYGEIDITNYPVKNYDKVYMSYVSDRVAKEIVNYAYENDLQGFILWTLEGDLPATNPKALLPAMNEAISENIESNKFLGTNGNLESISFSINNQHPGAGTHIVLVNDQGERVYTDTETIMPESSSENKTITWQEVTSDPSELSGYYVKLGRSWSDDLDTCGKFVIDRSPIKDINVSSSTGDNNGGFICDLTYSDKKHDALSDLKDTEVQVINKASYAVRLNFEIKDKVIDAKAVNPQVNKWGGPLAWDKPVKVDISNIVDTSNGISDVSIRTQGNWNTDYTFPCGLLKSGNKKAETITIAQVGNDLKCNISYKNISYNLEERTKRKPIMAYYANWNNYVSEHALPQTRYPIPGSYDPDRTGSNTPVTNEDLIRKLKHVDVLTYSFMEAIAPKIRNTFTGEMVEIEQNSGWMGTLFFSDPWADLAPPNENNPYGTTICNEQITRGGVGKAQLMCNFYTYIAKNKPWTDWYSDQTEGAPKSGIDLNKAKKMGNFDAFTQLKALWNERYAADARNDPNMPQELKLAVATGGYAHDYTHEVTFDNDTARNNFVNSVYLLFRHYPIDIIDLDYENPTMSKEQSEGFYMLVEALNNMIENPRTTNGNFKTIWTSEKAIEVTILSNPRQISGDDSYFLMVGGKKVPMGFEDGVLKKIAELKHVKSINLMTYDFFGGFTYTDDEKAKVGFNTRIYTDSADETYDNQFSIEKAVKAMIAAGVPSNKIGIGVPAYSRTLANIQADNIIRSDAKIVPGDWDINTCKDNLPLRDNNNPCSGAFSYRLIMEKVVHSDGLEKKGPQDITTDGRPSATMLRLNSWNPYCVHIKQDASVSDIPNCGF